MLNTFVNIITTFSFFSIIGWIIEVIFNSVQDRRFVNRGFFIGPYLPIYGFGALFAIILINMIHGFNPIIKIMIYFICLTIYEFIVGTVTEQIFKIKLWDYSKERLQFKGYVSLKFSLYWLLLICLFEYLIFPIFVTGITGISQNIKMMFSLIVLSCLLIDFFVVLIKGHMKKILKNEFALRREYVELSKDLLKNPAVKKLENSRHHRNKTRLEHVKEVAWLSFIWAKYLRLNTSSIVRGSLLHDLFYYDWMNRKEALRWHAFVHPFLALKNAQSLVRLTPKEKDIIKKHMWPLTVIPPFYLETLVVSLADKYCSLMDYLGVFKNINLKLKWIFINKS